MSKTLEKIKNSAIELLFVKGEFKSTSDDIAEHAKINRPLIYYYFNSTEDLINTITIETRNERDQKILEVLSTQAKLSQKISEIFDVHLQETIKYPFRQIYIATHPKKIKDSKVIHNPDVVVIQQLKHLFDEEIEKNNLLLNSSNQAVLLLSSYLNYPLLMISLGPHVFKLSKAEYIKLLKERKSLFLRLVFKTI